LSDRGSPSHGNDDADFGTPSRTDRKLGIGPKRQEKKILTSVFVAQALAGAKTGRPVK